MASRNGGVYSWCEDVIAARPESLDHGKLDQPACCTASGEHRYEIDRFGNECARNRDDGFLHKLIEAPQSP